MGIRLDPPPRGVSLESGPRPAFEWDQEGMSVIVRVWPGRPRPAHADLDLTVIDEHMMGPRTLLVKGQLAAFPAIEFCLSHPRLDATRSRRTARGVDEENHVACTVQTHFQQQRVDHQGRGVLGGGIELGPSPGFDQGWSSASSRSSSAASANTRSATRTGTDPSSSSISSPHQETMVSRTDSSRGRTGCRVGVRHDATGLLEQRGHPALARTDAAHDADHRYRCVAHWIIFDHVVPRGRLDRDARLEQFVAYPIRLGPVLLVPGAVAGLDAFRDGRLVDVVGGGGDRRSRSSTPARCPSGRAASSSPAGRAGPASSPTEAALLGGVEDSDRPATLRSSGAASTKAGMHSASGPGAPVRSA